MPGGVRGVSALACVAGSLRVIKFVAGSLRWQSSRARDHAEGSGGDFAKERPKISPAHLPFVAFSLFLSLSSAKIQYGTQNDVSPESTRTASYAG